MAEEKREIKLRYALIPVIFLIIALFFTIVILKRKIGDPADALLPHIPLIASAAVAAIVAAFHKYSWKEILEGMIHGINLAMGAVLILIVVGTLIGTWISGGVVPAMIYYGLKVLSPGIFLVATLIICSIVSLGTGSSWSTASTVGVALIGVSKGLGIPVTMAAGAIVSGAYFGDKMSPLSDTTNLAPAVAGTDVFSHIRHMIYTTGPGYVLAVILYGIIGTKYAGGTIDPKNLEVIFSTIKSEFFIHPVMFLPPILVILMVIKKIPPLPALLGGTFLGGLFTMIFQGKSLAYVIEIAESGYVLPAAAEAAEKGITLTEELAMMNELLSRGGLLSMMQTVALIICALSFGGIMERTGVLNTLAKALLKNIRRTGSLITATVISCIGLNAIASDQYIAIVIPGRMYKNEYEKRGLHPKNLSRALEDAGTLTSPLIPWNSCGAFMGAALGVNPLLYLPYAFLNLANPLISIFYGYSGITIAKKDENNSP